LSANDVSDVAVDDGIAYVAGHESGAGLHVVDVQAPAQPKLIAHLPWDGAIAVDMHNGLACVVGLGYRFALVDVTTPSAPTLVHEAVLSDDDCCSGRDWSRTCTLDGGRAYVSTPETVRIYNIVEPAHPILLGEFPPPDLPKAFVGRGDLLYVADNAEGLLVVDVADPASPTLIGRLLTDGWARDLALVGDLLHIADGEGGFLTVDVQDPTRPRILGQIDVSLTAHHVTVAGDLAYLSGSLEQFARYRSGRDNVIADSQLVVDISDPSSPALVSRISNRPGRLAVIGNVGFLAGGNQGFQILALSPLTLGETIVLDPTEMSVQVPAGLGPGPHHFLGVNPDGQYDILHNAFHVRPDADGDGFGADEDCDDQNAGVHPGAADLPGNTVDENCDGTLACDPTTEWKNRGAFVSCVARECARLRKAGMVSGRECGAVVSDAARSSTGKNRPTN
jgi:hypothetical protein